MRVLDTVKMAISSLGMKTEGRFVFDCVKEIERSDLKNGREVVSRIRTTESRVESLKRELALVVAKRSLQTRRAIEAKGGP